MLAKFKPLNAALDAAGFGRMPVESSLVSHVGPQDAQCAVVLMNSCWGCGAVEYIPAEFRDSVGPAIEAAIASGDPKVLSAYYDRQFRSEEHTSELQSLMRISYAVFCL